jgi:hypothetical protein
MGLNSFVAELFDRGQVRIAAGEAPSGEELSRTRELLVEFEKAYRLDLPGDPPELSLEAALWGATRLYRTCQFLVFRDLGAETIERELSVRCPGRANPATHYAVDLLFRFLPDAVKLARVASRDDPLVERLMLWAREWPLSSVGVAEVGPVKIDGFASDACLLALYVDRIIARRDTARLDDMRVRDGVRQALGLFSDLAPDVAKAIAAAETPGVTS